MKIKVKYNMLIKKKNKVYIRKNKDYKSFHTMDNFLPYKTKGKKKQTYVKKKNK